MKLHRLMCSKCQLETVHTSSICVCGNPQSYLTETPAPHFKLRDRLPAPKPPRYWSRRGKPAWAAK